MKWSIVIVLSTLSLSLYGCCTNRIVKPSDITLESAMISVGTGLAGMKTASRSVQSGLVPSEVVITFNVAASENDSETLALSASAPSSSPVTASGSVNLQAIQAANRGNQVTITLTNLLWAPTDKLIGNPETVGKLLDTLKSHGYDFYLVQTDTNSAAVRSHVETILKAQTAKTEQRLRSMQNKNGQ